MKNDFLTIPQLQQWQATRIAELKASGNCNYNSMMAVIAERDLIPAQELVTYYAQDGNQYSEWITGNAAERADKSNRFFRNHELTDCVANYTRRTKDRHGR